MLQEAQFFIHFIFLGIEVKFDISRKLPGYQQFFALSKKKFIPLPNFLKYASSSSNFLFFSFLFYD